jgi:putative transposase
MILTFKVKHNNDFSLQLKQAKQIAEFAVKNKFKLTSKHVKRFGLKSVITNQIIRKYGNNKKINKVTKVKLIVPNQGIKLNIITLTIKIPCLKIFFSYQFKHQFSNITMFL